MPPAELEEIIRNYPNVAEAAVIGIPHDKYGEVPRAYIVPQQGATVDCDKLISYVKEKVAPYKQIAGGVTVVDSIPKNASGKILRRELKLQYQTRGWKKNNSNFQGESGRSKKKGDEEKGLINILVIMKNGSFYAII